MSFRFAWVCVLAAGLSACSKLVPSLDEVIPDTRKNYERATSLPDLEVPPDLSTEAIRDRMAIPEGGKAAKFSTYQERRAEQQKVADVERSQNDAIRVLDNEHVLAVEGALVQVWPKLQEFWSKQGYALELDDVELGVIETAWREDKGELERDKFKIFGEAGAEAGTTVLYVTHEGEELSPRGEELAWQRRPRKIAHERRMVEALQGFLAGQGTTVVSNADGDDAPVSASPAPLAAVAEAEPVAETEPQDDSAPEAEIEPPEAADATAAADSATAAGDESLDEGLAGPVDDLDAASGEEAPQPKREDDAPVVGTEAPATGGSQHAEIVTVGGGKIYLTVAESFPAAWKITARALEQAGVEVKDSDKGRGVYIVTLATSRKPRDEGGMFKKLKFWGGDGATEYQVSLTGVGDKTEVVVLDREGRWETGKDAERLLAMLHDALNSGRI